ncbi:hypothetical protein CERSUDRAFT_74602 [Gelatoporia subvermispora B]|uniref:Uncharacterized protein n=1 Tax=Ceriporiopsis subvermispora (strain B) TaxID=914234 RepID=M2RAF0_CERS8|nr:hypothetical protein CERSUDRAFT_74602 [Gelatoporia subvermispora B]
MRWHYFYGFVVDSNAMVKRGLEKGLGHTATLLDREMTLTRAIDDLLAEADLTSWCNLASVIGTNGQQYWCIALASNNPILTPYTHRDMPPQELIDKLKATLQKPDHVKPMWFKCQFGR